MNQKNSFSIFCFLCWNLFFSQNCKQFQEGVFKIDIGFGNMSIERKGNFQLERSIDFGSVYLHKIEVISECEYILKRYRVILAGDLPKPNMIEMIKVQIYKVVDNNFFFHSQMLGTEQTLDGKFVKTSEVISKEFEEIIATEK
jgi:hypothetical protein